MPTKITVIYDTPADAELFEKSFPSQLESAGEIPDIERRRA